MKIISRSPCENYYGDAVLGLQNDRYYMCVENYDGYSWKEVSVAFAQAWLMEFGLLGTPETIGRDREHLNRYI